MIVLCYTEEAYNILKMSIYLNPIIAYDFLFS